MQNYNEYKKEAKKTLKAMFKLYEGLSENNLVYERSDDVLEALSSAIHAVAFSICPSDCCSIDDFRDWAFRE